MRTRLSPLAFVLLAIGSVAGWLVGSGRLPQMLAQPAKPGEPPAGGQLPKPDPAFTGKIGETYKDSTPSYPLPVAAPKGAPNVLLVMLDDVGFGMCSTFGGPVPTPHLDQLAKNGLTYNRFHTTALCSPTRAAFLTGRNHHTSGTGVIIEMGTGYPGYTGIIPKSTALVSQTLRDNGYATAMFGKWHNTPEGDIGPAGPFDRWPTGLGFDYFYGFNQGETDQYYPTLYRNTTWVKPPKRPDQGYHFTADMTDEAIAWTRNVRAANPDKPWFNYFSTPGVHAPHQVSKEWRDKFKGQFDHGWDQQRVKTHARQLELGLIPKGTKLTPRPQDIPAWADQPADARKVYARLMENYAAYMAYTDAEVGRLIESLKQSGELDNAPVPSREAVLKAREELRKAAAGEMRQGGQSQQNSTTRKKQREALFNEFGGAKRGYVVCPWTGIKMHWTDDPAINPKGYPKFERGKIFVKAQGGGYQLENLIPESFAANRARNDQALRKENRT